MAGILAISTSGLLFFNGCQKQDTSVTIGAVIPLTGAGSEQGNYMRQGMELALKDAITSGLVKKDDVKLLFEDSQLNPAKAVNAFNKLLNSEKIVACIPATSGVTLALKPIANKNKVVLINASAISPDIEDANDYIFSILPDADFEGTFLANFGFTKLGGRRAAIIYRNDPSGIGFFKAIKKRFNELGGVIAYSDTSEPNSDRFDTQLTKIAEQKDIDSIYVMMFCYEVANFVKQARERNIKAKILTYETFFSSTAIDIAKDAANGVVFCAPQFDVNSRKSNIILLRNKVRDIYGATAFNYYIAIHYDATMILLKAISAGNKNGESIKNYLNGLNEYYGTTGTIKFTERGSAIVPLVVYETINKKFIQILK